MHFEMMKHLQSILEWQDETTSPTKTLQLGLLDSAIWFIGLCQLHTSNMEAMTLARTLTYAMT
jgi:hypothetical protein